MMAERGPPKKKKKGSTKASTESSIVPVEFESPAPCMSFPPSQSTEGTSKNKKRKGDTSSEKSLRSKSQSGSNQPEALSLEYPAPSSNSGEQVEKAPTKAKGKKRAAPKQKMEKKQLLQDSPAMGTRSKAMEPSSPDVNQKQKEA
ncbi:unnamed protein product [Urochloa humidicola]